MDSHQAKEILIFFREGIDQPDDPEFSEALALLPGDPELAAWLEQQRAVQAKIRAGFQQIPVPDALKEQIVSERRARMTLGFKRKAMLLASAAALVVVLASVILLLNQPPGEDRTFTGYSNRMARLVLRSYPKMDLETDDLARIHQYLAQQGRGDYVLPSPLAKTAGTGCKVLTWQGKPVSMVCFNSGNNAKPKQPDLFLFVINQDSVPDNSAAAPGVVVQVSKLAMLRWTQNGKLYLLGALGTKAKQVQDSVAAGVRR